MVTIDVNMIWQQSLKLFTITIESLYVLQYQLHEYKSGFCFQRKYNLNSKLLSIEISHELEAEVLLEKNEQEILIVNKCVKFKYKDIRILQEKEVTCNFRGTSKSLDLILSKRNILIYR